MASTSVNRRPMNILTVTFPPRWFSQLVSDVVRFVLTVSSNRELLHDPRAIISTCNIVSMTQPFIWALTRGALTRAPMELRIIHLSLRATICWDYQYHRFAQKWILDVINLSKARPLGGVAETFGGKVEKSGPGLSQLYFGHDRLTLIARTHISVSRLRARTSAACRPRFSTE